MAAAFRRTRRPLAEGAEAVVVVGVKLKCRALQQGRQGQQAVRGGQVTRGGGGCSPLHETDLTYY